MTRHSASSTLPNSCDGAYSIVKAELLAHRMVYRALIPPGYHNDWHVAVRVASTKKLVGFVAAVPIHVRVRDKYAILQTCCSLLLTSVSQRPQCKRSELPMCSQEAAFEASRASAHQGGHATMPSQGCLSSFVHRRRSPSDSSRDMQVRLDRIGCSGSPACVDAFTPQVLPSVSQHPKARQRPLHHGALEHDSRAHDPPAQSP